MGYNIVGADGQIMDGGDMHAESILGAIESGAYDSMGPEQIMGLAFPLIQRATPAARPQLMQRANAYATALRNNPNLTRQLIAAAGPIHLMTGPQVQPQPAPTPAQIREVVQGLDSVVALAAGASLVLTFNATMTFRPTRLMVGPAFAPLFTIDDLKVSADSLFLSPGPVPAEVFLPNAVTASAIKRRTAAAGTPLFVTITNVDVAAHRFRGALFGEALDQGSCG